MPGQLSAVHAGFEAECERCHAPAGDSQDPACRKCHADIGTTSRSAIHIASKENCSVCHPKTRYEAPPKCDGCHDAAMKYQPGQKLSATSGRAGGLKL
jgi:hypothetical protein